MGSRVTRVTGFLPANFQLPVPFSTEGQARDRQTRAINALWPILRGRGHKKVHWQPLLY